MLGLGLGLQYGSVLGPSYDSQAVAHYNRVIADGGVIPAGLNGLNNLVVAIKAVYGVTNITTALNMGLDPQYFGYKLGAGSGTTLGMAAQKLYSICGATGDVTQTTAANQPLVLPYSSTDGNYFFSSGVTGNYASTPNAAANRITGDITLIVEASMLSWTPSAVETLVAKDNTAAGGRSYALNIQTNGRPRFNFSLDGTAIISVDCTAATGFSAWQKRHIAVERTASTGDVRFYTSVDGVTFTQLGTTVSSTSGSIFAGNAEVQFGALSTSSLNLVGNIYDSEIYSGLQISGSGAVLNVDFDPQDYNPSVSQTTFTSVDTGEVWTINIGSASTGYKSVLVDRTYIQGEGVNDQLFQTTLNRPNTLTQYVAFNAYANTGGGGGQIIDSTDVNYSNCLDPETNTTVAYYMNGALSGRSRTKNIRTLGLATAWSEAGVENGLTVNNGILTSNAYTPTPSNTGVRLMARANAAAFANALLSTYLVSNGRDSSTIRTGMYNTIRGINNNAF